LELRVAGCGELAAMGTGDCAVCEAAVAADSAVTVVFADVGGEGHPVEFAGCGEGHFGGERFRIE
jgi:hypothetical protein